MTRSLRLLLLAAVALAAPAALAQDCPGDVTIISTQAQVDAFAVEDATDVRLAVYDTLGREVAVLMEGSVPAGRHEAMLDGADFVAGTHLVRLTTAEGLVASHRLTLLR